LRYLKLTCATDFGAERRTAHSQLPIFKRYISNLVKIHSYNLSLSSVAASSVVMVLLYHLAFGWPAKEALYIQVFFSFFQYHFFISSLIITYYCIGWLCNDHIWTGNQQASHWF
jgi:hypothetical protein